MPLVGYVEFACIGQIVCAMMRVKPYCVKKMFYVSHAANKELNFTYYFLLLFHPCLMSLVKMSLHFFEQ